ncbi:hypothetical protein [Bradyrhizobium sp. 15]|uniref:hypothetical protein n=1 Tax=Bradyrhizobium sp. 15 TaxID=2782633 RepID=UPI001FFB7448|nr:hypothetical protein [Bradyrhizobium sp. 15]MCK1434938.1 hypothetical protein [Bradyrhizobium sp. 15]
MFVALKAPLAMLAAVWSIATFPVFLSAEPAKEIGARVILGDRFKLKVLNDVLAMANDHAATLIFQRSHMARDEALIRLRLSEDALERMGPAEANLQIAKAIEKIRFSLASNPTDPFLWLMLYSTEGKEAGLTKNSFKYLEWSYDIGPREGWISLRRNQIALANFQSVSAATQRKVLAEFRSLLNDGFVEQAAVSLETAGWPEREKLVAVLDRVDLRHREALAKRLLTDGIEVNVPGVRLDDRLWR